MEERIAPEKARLTGGIVLQAHVQKRNRGAQFPIYAHPTLFVLNLAVLQAKLSEGTPGLTMVFELGLWRC